METVTLPASLVEKMLQAGESFAEFSDELEDFLLSQDSKFIAKMRAARANHLEGKTKPLSALEREVSQTSKAKRRTARNNR